MLRRPIMCAAIVLISCFAYGQKPPCTDAMSRRSEQEADSLTSWDGLYRSYKLFGRCDDGSIAEGYSESVARILADAGIAALTVHGRTRAQGYSGAADWNVIGEVAAAVPIPVIGNGDLSSAADVAKRRNETGIAGAMIGRAAMSAPWIFRDTKTYLATGEIVDPPGLPEKWSLILRHCQLAVQDWGAEEPAIRSMRARLMAYSKSMPEAKRLREKFSHVSTIAEIEAIADENLSTGFTELTEWSKVESVKSG